MRTAWRKFSRCVRALVRGETGAAAVEFALILPVMLLVYIGSMEVSAAISMDRRVQSVTGALGDLVARSDTYLPASTLNDYFRAAAGIMNPYAVSGLRQLVTQVEVRADGTTRVVWCRQFLNNATSVCAGRPVNATFPLPVAMTNISRGKFVIVAEATYTYLPLYGYALRQSINLYRQNFFMPRFGGTITIN